MLETLTALQAPAALRNAERSTHRGESATSAVTVSAGESGANWYVYCSNNPLSFIDPTGLEQNVLQKLYTGALSVAKTIPGAEAIIKVNTKVDVDRSAADNGANGNYFQSTSSVSVFGIKVNDVKTQSTLSASTNLANDDITLPKGEYNLTLKEKTASYLKPLSITSSEKSPTIQNRDGTEMVGGIKASSGFLMHPNEVTNPDNPKFGTVYSPNPFSKGCQIVNGKNEYTETRNILESIGFKNGDTTRMVIK